MRPSTIVGIAALVLIAVVILNGARTEGPGSRGVPEGEVLPDFAMPLADGGPDLDANVLERESGGVPAACEVRGPEVLNVCELREEGPVVLGFFATRSENCEDQIDALDEYARSASDVSVAAVAIRGSQADAARVVRERGWEIPVGWDRDGAVANLYAVAVCPTITFAREGGEVVSTSLQSLTADEIAEQVEAARR